MRIGDQNQIAPGTRHHTSTASTTPSTVWSQSPAKSDQPIDPLHVALLGRPADAPPQRQAEQKRGDRDRA